MWSEIAAIYRASKKKRDINWFTEWVARPPAAVFVYALRDTRITPNQVTFGSALLAAGACAMFALLPGWLWGLAAALVFEASFVLDCVDGQLARVRKLASPLGHLLDFLMDELKAMLLLGSITVRLWQERPDAPWLLVVGLGAVFCLAAGLMLTSFMRRPEYGAKPPTEDGQPAQVGGRRGPIGAALSAIEWCARIVVHYPQYLWLCAAAGRLDVFFWAYSAVNALYFAKSFATIFVKLGKICGGAVHIDVDDRGSVKPTRAILIAAGRGRRLGTHTDEIPKCMVEVGGRPILGWIWRALAASGVDELVVIRGYRGDVLERFVRSLVPRAIFVDNPQWQTNNVLLSLACARPYLDRACYLTYSDIIFTPAVVAAAAASPADFGLVIDREFRTIYEGRTEHPLDEGEVADLRRDGAVARVGKRALPPADAIGEFIGLTKLSATGAELSGAALDALAGRFAGRDDQPFQRAATYRNAYLTDLWQELIDHGTRLDPVLIEGQWREIDTGQDLDRARELVESHPKEWT